MPGKGQDDRPLVSGPKPADSISSSSPNRTRPKSEISQSKTEEIPQAEILVESEVKLPVAAGTEAPLFRIESAQSAVSALRSHAEPRAKKAAPKSAAVASTPDSASTSPAAAVRWGIEPKQAPIDHTEQVFSEIQPPLAVLAIALLALLLLL